MKRTFIIDWMTVFAYRNHFNAHFPIRISKLRIYISDTMYVRVREDLILCWILVFSCDRYIIGLNEWLGSVAFIAILILFVLNLKKRKRLIQDQWRHKGIEKKKENGCWVGIRFDIMMTVLVADMSSSVQCQRRRLNEFLKSAFFRNWNRLFKVQKIAAPSMKPKILLSFPFSGNSQVNHRPTNNKYGGRRDRNEWTEWPFIAVFFHLIKFFFLKNIYFIC